MSNILNALNDKYGTEFTDADRLYFEQLEQALFENDDLKLRAQSNPLENFKYAFEEVFIQTLIDRMRDNEDIFEKIMENSEFKTDVTGWLTQKIYKRFNTPAKGRPTYRLWLGSEARRSAYSLESSNSSSVL